MSLNYTGCQVIYNYNFYQFVSILKKQLRKVSRKIFIVTIDKLTLAKIYVCSQDEISFSRLHSG